LLVARAEEWSSYSVTKLALTMFYSSVNLTYLKISDVTHKHQYDYKERP
jgi:hypothetical protein